MVTGADRGQPRENTSDEDTPGVPPFAEGLVPGCLSGMPGDGPPVRAAGHPAYGCRGWGDLSER